MTRVELSHDSHATAHSCWSRWSLLEHVISRFAESHDSSHNKRTTQFAAPHAVSKSPQWEQLVLRTTYCEILAWMWVPAVAKVNTKNKWSEMYRNSRGRVRNIRLPMTLKSRRISRISNIPLRRSSWRSGMCTPVNKINHVKKVCPQDVQSLGLSRNRVTSNCITIRKSGVRIIMMKQGQQHE